MAGKTSLKETLVDLLKLQKMEEPLTVRVEKDNGGAKTPIDLPIKEGYTVGGAGWTKDEVIGLEGIVLKLSGGGRYRATVASANNEQMVWGFYYPESTYPSIVPISNSESSMLPAGSVIRQPAPIGGSMVLPFQQAQPQPVAQPVQQPLYSQPIFSNANGNDDRFRRLEDELRRSEREKAELAHKVEMERVGQQHAADMAAMRDEMRRVAEGLKARPESDELAKMRADMERQRQEFEQREARREQERAEERHRAEIAALSSKMDSRFEQLLASQNRGPDPTMEFMRESLRQQAELAKEQSRAQQQIFERMTPFMVAPTQLAEMMTRKNDGADVLLRNVTESVGNVLSLQQRMFEAASNLTNAPAQHPALNLLQGGLEKAGELTQQYLAMQRDKSVMESRAQAAIAQSNAQIAQAEVIKANGAKAGLNGAMAVPQVAAHVVPPVVTAPVGGSPNSLPNATPPTEEQMFGAVLDAVEHLRAGVAAGKTTPVVAVDAVMQGIDHFEKNKIPAPPVFFLFVENRFADLWDVLLPKANPEFRMACANEMANRVGEGEEDGGDEGEDDEQPVAAVN